MSDDELARAVGAAVLGVPGVLHAYDARPVIAAVVADAATAVRAGIAARVAPAGAGAVAPPSPILVSRGAEGLTVGVKIAVSDVRPAAATCRDVYAAVADVLAELADGGSDGSTTVSVQIARIG